MTSHRFSVESKSCVKTLPSASIIMSSETVGWTSLLAEFAQESEPSDPFVTHVTPDQTVVVIRKGTIDFEVQDGNRWRKTDLRPGLIGSRMGGIADRMRWRLRPGHDFLRSWHVFVPEATILEAAEHLRRPGQTTPSCCSTIRVFPDDVVTSLADKLLLGISSGYPDIYAQVLAQWLAFHLLESRTGWKGHDDERQAGSITDARLTRAIDYINANLSRTFDLEAIAAEASVSKFHFTRIFHKKTGVTPLSYLQSVRLIHAERLLITTDLAIRQVAVKSGFQNVTHFNRRFRQHFGKSPSAIRRGQ